MYTNAFGTNLFADMLDILMDLIHMFLRIKQSGYTNKYGESVVADIEDMGTTFVHLFTHNIVLFLAVAVIGFAWQPFVRPAINNISNLLNPAPPAVNLPAVIVVPSQTLEATPTPTETMTPTVRPTLTLTASPTPTETSTPLVVPTSLMASAEDLLAGLLRAFDSCVQGSGGDIKRMKELLSPFGEIVGLVHPWDLRVASGDLRACLFVVKEEEAIGTLYFVVASPTEGWRVAMIQYKNEAP